MKKIKLQTWLNGLYLKTAFYSPGDDYFTSFGRGWQAKIYLQNCLAGGTSKKDLLKIPWIDCDFYKRG